MEHPMRRREVVVQPDIEALVPAPIAACIRVCEVGFFVLLYARFAVESMDQASGLPVVMPWRVWRLI
jgi:hypothetical protein